MTWHTSMPWLESTPIRLKAGKFVTLWYVPLFNMFFQSILSFAMCYHVFCLHLHLQMVLSEETAPSWGELQSEQMKFSILLIFLVCSLLLCHFVSFCETFPFSQLPRSLHVEAECETRGQGHVQWNALYPVHATTAERQWTSWRTGDWKLDGVGPVDNRPSTD